MSVILKAIIESLHTIAEHDDSDRETLLQIVNDSLPINEEITPEELQECFMLMMADYVNHAEDGAHDSPTVPCGHENAEHIAADNKDRLKGVNND